MELRRDEHGRPVGLQWPERPPVDPEILKEQTRKAFSYSVSRKGMGGQQRKELCGAELHDMSQWGVEIKGGTGGRYCRKCKNERQREYQRRKRNASINN